MSTESGQGYGALLSACSSDSDIGPIIEPPSPEAPVTIVPDHAIYTRSDLVTLRVRNDAATPIGYNFCPTQLEVLVGTSWHRYDDGRGDSFPCPASLTTLEAGHTTAFEYSLPRRPGLGITDSEYKSLPRPDRTRRWERQSPRRHLRCSRERAA